jgi:hypothetical protein
VGGLFRTRQLEKDMIRHRTDQNWCSQPGPIGPAQGRSWGHQTLTAANNWPASFGGSSGIGFWSQLGMEKVMA